MIKIESYSKNKESDSNTSNNGGGTRGFANATTTIKTELETHELWGNKFNGTQDINGDLTSKGNIKAENAYVTNEVSGNTANFNNLSATTLTSETATFTSVTSQTISSSEIKANEITSPKATINEITSKNINNSETITTKNLKVTSSAHFFELIIDRVKSVGGSMLITPADGFDVDIVQDSPNEVKLLWQCQDEDGNQRDNMWKVNDQALCLSFNKAKVGTTHNVANKYYWALVTSVNKTNEPTVIDGVKYNYITLSKTTVDGTLNPEFGDSIVMCGYRGTDDHARQSAIYISAYKSLDGGLTAPLFAQYQGINDFNLQSHRKSYYDAVSAKFIGEFEATDGQNIIDIINNKIADSEASIKLDTKNIVLSVSEKTRERRNLLKGTTFHRQIDNFFISSAARIEMNSGYNGTNCIKVIDDTDGTSHYYGVFWDGSQQNGRSVKIEKGKKYTISCYYKTNDTNANFSLEAIYTDKETNAKRLGRPKFLSPNYFYPKYGEWQLCTTVIDTTYAESDYIAFNFWEYCTTESGRIEAYICRPMVEEGDTYYGWTVSDEDNDYIGANLIDNSRTFEVGGNTLEAKGTKTLKGDTYELTYEGSNEYNTFYRIDATNFKLDTDYTLSCEVRGDAKYIGVYAYYPITKTPYTLFNEAMGNIMYEQNGDGTKVAYPTLLTNDDIEREKKIWVHFKFSKRLPIQIYFQFPKNQDQSGVTSWNVTITKPKIEEGANVTQWTEKKTDIDNTITTINSNVATLTQKADSIEAKVTSNTTTINNINGQVTTNKSDIATLTEKANSIEGNVTSNTTKINNINGQVTTNKTDIANLKIKADGIESTVSSLTKSYGTNLFSFTNTNFQDGYCRSAIQMNGFYTYKLNQGFYRLKNLNTNGEGGDFVVSFDARVLKNTTVNVNFCDIGAEENNGDIALTTAFQHYVLHFKNIQSDYLDKALYNGFIDFEPKTQDETNQLYVANFMLERGTIPSSNFTLSDADRNNYGNKESFSNWETYSTVTTVYETINGKSTKAYKIEVMPSGSQYVDILKASNLQKSMKIEPQKVYTLSFYAKASESGHGIETFLYPNINDMGVQDIQYKNVNGAGTQTAYSSKSDGYTLCELDTTWRKFYVHWHPHMVGDIYNCVCGRLKYNMTVYIAEAKLEEGYISEENLSNQETYTMIQQTADEILLKASNTYVKIGDGNITLNGDTQVNGSLTLNDEDQGFLLLGDGGTTEISPKSIGTYEEFKKKSTNVIKTVYSKDNIGIGFNPAPSWDTWLFTFNVGQDLGTLKKGSYLKFTKLYSEIYANNGDEKIGLGLGTGDVSIVFRVFENDVLKKTFNIEKYQFTYNDIGDYTVEGDNANVRIVGAFKVIAKDSLWQGVEATISTTTKWNNEIPTPSYMLIGYDGFAVNFGNNKTVYCGADGFIANYGVNEFRITSDGIWRNNHPNVKVVKGTNDSNSPATYTVQEPVDTVLCTGNYCKIIFPPNPYEGQTFKILDKALEETYINSNGKKVVDHNTGGDGRVLNPDYLGGQVFWTYVYIDGRWYESSES